MPEDDGKEFARQVGAKESRKLRAQRRVMHTVWSGLGMMGLVGWSIVVPTLIGAAFGIWLDKRYPAAQSWMVTFLFIGLAIGCLNAWHWVAKEQRDIRAEQEEPDHAGDADE
ncbi:MAG TPA: AtpZ/AtpI family protein [Gallionella sp.]|nr:AtpZ/AtpI family protein [Gallionella sp.]